jgi:uncharacterized membrane protein
MAEIKCLDYFIQKEIARDVVINVFVLVGLLSLIKMSSLLFNERASIRNMALSAIL